MEKSRQHDDATDLPPGKNPVTIEFEAPTPIWMFWGREESLTHTEIQTPDRSATSIATTPLIQFSLSHNLK
jgi:hypothetical protein